MKANKTHLMELCERGSSDWVEMEIENGAQVNEKDKDGFTALHFACMYGYKDIVEFLIQNGAEIKHIEPGLIKNPLMLACENGHKDVVELLIQSGFDIDLDKYYEPNSFHIACLKGYRSIAELLLQVGYQFVSSNDQYSKEHLLLGACTNGHLEIVKLLIEMDTNVMFNSGRDSPLYKAIENGHAQIVELLLVNQENKNVKKNYGFYCTELAEHAIRDIYIFLRNMVIRKFYKSFNCLDLYNLSPSSFWEWTFDRKFRLLLLVRDFRCTLTTIVKKNDFYVGYDELRNAKILSYFQSDNFIAELKFKLEHLKMLKEKIKLKISQIKNKITDFRENKHSFDRNFTELEKNEMISHENLMEFINLIQDDQMREKFLKKLDSWLCDLKSNSTYLADEFHQIHDLVTSEKLSAFLRSDKAIDEVSNEIKTISFQRIYGKRSPLIIACENNNVALVQHLITRGEDINVQDVDGKTPLMKACFMNHFELAQMLLLYGADVQIEDENGENVAFFIKTSKETKKGDLTYRVFTNLFNTKKIDVNKANRFGETLLFCACYHTQLDIIDFLFDYGADSKIRTKFIQNFILYEASIAFSYLFAKGAEILDFNDLDVPYTFSYTPYGSPLGHVFELDYEGEIIPLFYEKGYLKNVSVDRLLRIACLSRNFKLIKYFVEKGANVNHYDEDGNSALIILAKSAMEDILEPVKCLVDHGADINHFNNAGISALYYACEPDQKPTCAFLIEQGASLYQNGTSIFLDVNEPCQYLFCSGLLRNLYKLFKSHEASVLRKKIFKSIEITEIGLIDSLRAFKLIYDEEDKVTNAKELRNDRILEYFASFDFREKFVTDVLINLKDKLELLNVGKNKIKLHFPGIKTPSIEKFNLPISKIVNNQEIISVDFFMEKFREHKKQNEMEFKSLNEPLGKFNEETLGFLEILEWLLGDNLIDIINQESEECAKTNKAFILCKIINYYSLELERILNASNKLFDFLSQEEVRFFLNLK